MNGLAVQAYKLLIGIALAAVGIPADPGTLSARAVVSSGHRGAVLDMVEDSSRGLLFSVGEDGFLRVWDSGAAILLRRIAVTRLEAQSIALDPTAPLAAVVVTDGVRSYAVDVWDWDAEKRLYSIPLQSVPLFVRFSRTGTYLLCGDMQWESLHIFHASDGTPVPFHPEGFGMVSFAEVSRSDATLMTYQTAGRISYWDIATGNPIKEVTTVGGLLNVRTSDDRSSLVGQSGGRDHRNRRCFRGNPVPRGCPRDRLHGHLRGRAADRLPFPGRLTADAGRGGQCLFHSASRRRVRLAATSCAHDAGWAPCGEAMTAKSAFSPGTATQRSSPVTFLPG